jgi:hypothetical protein
MRALLVVLFLAVFSEAILPRGQDSALQSREDHLKFATLFEKCNAGFPILLETGDLPGNHRANGDPCSSDIQCESELCRCTNTGGKECVPHPRDCDAVDALFALDAECWDGRSATWNTLGYEPAYSIDVGGLDPSPDGTLRAGVAAGSFHFNGDVKVVRGLNIGPAAHPQLSLEIWVKRLSNKNVREWIVGHDNGGYDRAIALNDNRFGGVAGPNGAVYVSTLGYLSLNQWYHVVVTYNHVNNGAGSESVYLNGVRQVIGGPNNGEGLPDMTIGGLSGSFPGHDVDALISQVRVYARELSPSEVQSHYTSASARYGR